MFNKRIKLLFTVALVLGFGVSTFNSALAETISKIDRNGTAVELPEEINRIATLWPVLTGIIISLDQGADRLVAIPPQIKRSYKKGIMFEVFPGLKKIAAKEVINNKRQANTEELLKLDPDVVFQSADKNKSIEALRAAGLTVFGLKYTKNNLERILLTDVGAVIGREDRAREILSMLKQDFEEISAKTSGIGRKDRPTVVYIWGKNKMVGAKHHVIPVLQAAGATNGVSMGKSFIGYDPEKLLKLDPDFIFLHNVIEKKIPADFYNDPVYAGMKAVKNRTIYKVPKGGAANWDGPSAERGLALDWFTRIINGNDFLDGSLRAKIKEVFPKLYGKDVTDALINRMLSAAANKDSAGYDEIIQ